MKLMRILSGILASVIATGCLLYTAPPKMISDPVLNAYAATVDDLTFTVYDGVVTLAKCSTSATGEIEIPAEYDGKPVTMIAEKAFSNCISITNVILSENITQIPRYCFIGCTNLHSVYIPESVNTIAHLAFSDCTSIREIDCPNSISTIESAFENCVLERLIVRNPNCKFYNIGDSSTFLLGTIQTLCGYMGSTTESIAKRNGITFVALEGTPPTTTRITTTTANATTTMYRGTTRATATTTIKMQDGLRKFDINKDSYVNIADAVLLTHIVSEDEAAVIPKNSEPDVNADGLVTIDDVMSVLQALQPFSIQIGKVTAKPGQKVTVPIKIYADKGTAAGQIYVGCDSRLAPVSVKNGDAYTMNFSADCEAYPITITWTAKGGKDQVAKNGAVLAYLEFEVDPNIKSSEYLEISIMPQAGSYATSFSDSSGITYTAGYRSGYITVIP